MARLTDDNWGVVAKASLKGQQSLVIDAKLCDLPMARLKAR